jgi:tetratricopeptide (TPR) repeat protein
LGKKKKERSAAPRARGRHQLLAAAALCAVMLVAYSNSFGTGFVLDNRGLILQDTRIREASSRNIGLVFQHTYWWPIGESGLYRPFTTLSYLFNYAVLGEGDRPAGYHWVNWLLHAGNVLLLYALARRFLRDFWPPVFLAAVWAVHPVLTESVTNIAGRADLLAGMATLSGFLMYLKSTETAGWRRAAWLAGLMAVTAVGVFSKESAVTVLGVIALYELAWWKERRQVQGLFLGCLAMLPPIQVMLYQRAAVLAGSAPTVFPFTDNPLVAAGFWTARLTAIKVMAKYLGLLAWPAKLSCDYSWAQIRLASGGVEDWTAWLAVAAVAVAVALLARRNRAVFFVAGCALMTFLPASNLLFPMGTIMAERLLYLPSIGLAACVVAVIGAMARRTRVAVIAPVALCAITAAFAIRTWARNTGWRDDLTLATAAVQTSPESFKSHKMLAAALYDSDPSHANIGRVIEEAEKGLAVLDPLPDSRNNADAYRRASSYYVMKGGMAAYQRSLDLLLRCASMVKADHARFADVQQLMSTAYLRLGDARKALDAAEQGRNLDPANPDVYLQLSAVHRAGKRAEDAAITLMEGVLVTKDPGLRAELVNLYRNGLDTKGCALMPGANGPALNPSCETVHRHLCAASVGTIRIRLESGRRDLAEDMRSSALRDFGCPAGPLDQALAAGAAR